MIVIVLKPSCEPVRCREEKLVSTYLDKDNTHTWTNFFPKSRQTSFGGVHKLRIQEVGRQSRNVLFLSTFIRQKISTDGGRWSKKTKNLSTQFVNAPFHGIPQDLNRKRDDFKLKKSCFIAEIQDSRSEPSCIVSYISTLVSLLATVDRGKCLKINNCVAVSIKVHRVFLSLECRTVYKYPAYLWWKSNAFAYCLFVSASEVHSRKQLDLYDFPLLFDSVAFEKMSISMEEKY